MNKKLISLITMTAITLTSVSSVLAKSFTPRQNVALDHAWTVKFNQKVNVNEAFEGVYIKDSKGNEISTRISFSDDHTKMIITPDDGYAPNSTYTLNVEGVSNEEGKPLSDKATMQFTTANTPQKGSFDINSVTANKDQGSATTNLDPNSSFSVQLSKYVDSSTLKNITVTDEAGNKANVNVVAIGTNINIEENNAFWDDTHTVGVLKNTYKCNTTYTINFAGLKSSDGQDISTKSYKFTTRDYKFEPTTQGICNDDYINYSNQYSQQLFNPVDPATGQIKSGLWQAHDNNGTLVYDTDKRLGAPKYQPDSHWNKYANLQARNQYDLQIEFQNEYKKIADKSSSYDSKRLVSFTSAVSDPNDNKFDLYLNHGAQSETPTFTTSIYNDTSLDTDSIKRLDNSTVGSNTVLGNIQKEQHAQVYIGVAQEQGVQNNLQKLYLYQHLVSLFGYDYASQLFDYVISQSNTSNSARDTLQTTQIGNIKVWCIDGQFLFKY